MPKANPTNRNFEQFCPAFWMSTLFLYLRSMNFVPFQRFWRCENAQAQFIGALVSHLFRSNRIWLWAHFVIEQRCDYLLRVIIGLVLFARSRNKFQVHICKRKPTHQNLWCETDIGEVDFGVALGKHGHEHSVEMFRMEHNAVPKLGNTIIHLPKLLIAPEISNAFMILAFESWTPVQNRAMRVKLWISSFETGFWRVWRVLTSKNGKTAHQYTLGGRVSQCRGVQQRRHLTTRIWAVGE